MLPEPVDANGMAFGLVLGERRQFLGRIDRGLRLDHQDRGRPHHQGDGREIAQRIVVRLAQMRRHHDRAGGGQKQQVPVRLTLRHVVGADGAVRARLVLDDDVLARGSP